MTPFRSEKVIRPADQDHVRILSFCSAEEIRRYAFDDQFGTHAHYKSLYTRRESLEKNAAQTDANVVLAVTDPSKIVGFGVLAYPDSEERWAQLEPQVMIEVKALEVSRSWRRHRLAPGIVEMMLSHPLIEEKIAYFVGYSWTWDLDGTGLSALQYRRMMIRLFEPYGFQEFQTNEPNICLKPENIFMGRIGARVSPETRNRFKWLRFGISAD
jgi:acetoin utilization protein AcuA